MSPPRARRNILPDDPDHAPRPLIVPVFIPHAGCPHRCVFCDQQAITGQDENLNGQARGPAQVRQRIDTFLAAARPRSNNTQIAFFGGNFLGLPRAEIKALLDTAAGYVDSGQAHAIRFSTRPDSVSNQRLDLLRPYPVSVVELGAQSMDERVLAQSRRGHSAVDTTRAARRLLSRGYTLGLQLMTGLPGETESMAVSSARSAAALTPALVRIYPTVVFKNSRLARWYRAGRYHPLDLPEAVSRAKQMYNVFHAAGIAVVRMGLHTLDDPDALDAILAGPYHPAFGHLVHAERFLDRAVGLFPKPGSCDRVRIHVHPRSVSKMRGYKNHNTRELMRRFRVAHLEIVPDRHLSLEEIRLETTPAVSEDTRHP